MALMKISQCELHGNCRRAGGEEEGRRGEEEEKEGLHLVAAFVGGRG